MRKVLFIIFICLFFCVSCSKNIENNYINLEASNGKIIIDTKDITNVATYANYVVDDVTIQFILVRGSDGVVRIAFNTCQVCNPSPNAYFVQKGDYFECQNSGAKFHIDDLGIISGGCNPTPVIKKTETENKIIIDKTYVESFKNKFVNWNGSVGSENK